MFVKRPKELGLIIFVCLYSLFVFGVFELALTFRDGWLLTLAAVFLTIALLFWVSIMSLAAMLTAHHKLSTLGVSVVPSLALAIIGFGSLISFVAAMILAVIVYSGQRLTVREIDDRISFKVPRIFRLSIRMIASGLLISLLGLTLPVFIQNIDTQQLAIPEQYVESLLLPLDPLVENLFPGFEQSQTVDEMIDQHIEEELANLPPGTTIEPGQKEEIRQQLSERLGNQLSGQETLSSIVAQRINNFLLYLFEVNPMLIATGLLLLAFLTLRALLPFVVWPSLGIISILIWIMLKTGFIRKEMEQKQVERLYL